MTNSESGLRKPGADMRVEPIDASAAVAAAIPSATLMNGRREVVILHVGERYRLRVTANDRLILTK